MVKSAKSVVTVAAAVVERDGRFLVARRGPGVHLEGYWEFPGGKLNPGETDAACLARELAEELGVEVTSARLIQFVSHAYADRTVELHFYACTIAGEPRALLNQEIRWVTKLELAELRLPPADEELVRTLTGGLLGTEATEATDSTRRSGDNERRTDKTS